MTIVDLVRITLTTVVIVFMWNDHTWALYLTVTLLTVSNESLMYGMKVKAIAVSHVVQTMEAMRKVLWSLLVREREKEGVDKGQQPT